LEERLIQSGTLGFWQLCLRSSGLPRPDLLANHPMESIVTILVWQWTPFMMLILLAGLQSLNQEEVEAAQMDGANGLMLFGYIILPHLRRYIEIALLMETLFILSEFGVIFVTTSGDPAFKPPTYPLGFIKKHSCAGTLVRQVFWGVCHRFLPTSSFRFLYGCYNVDNQKDSPLHDQKIQRIVAHAVDIWDRFDLLLPDFLDGAYFIQDGSRRLRLPPLADV
jgi:hypothetical protein